MMPPGGRGGEGTFCGREAGVKDPDELKDKAFSRCLETSPVVLPLALTQERRVVLPVPNEAQDGHISRGSVKAARTPSASGDLRRALTQAHLQQAA